MNCVNCGGTMDGDGYTCPYVCENAEEPDCAEADSGPWYCNYEEERKFDLYVWKDGHYSKVLNTDILAEFGEGYTVVCASTTFGELAKMTPQQIHTITSLMQGKEV